MRALPSVPLLCKEGPGEVEAFVAAPSPGACKRASPSETGVQTVGRVSRRRNPTPQPLVGLRYANPTYVFSDQAPGATATNERATPAEPGAPVIDSLI